MLTFLIFLMYIRNVIITNIRLYCKASDLKKFVGLVTTFLSSLSVKIICKISMLPK